MRSRRLWFLIRVAARHLVGHVMRRPPGGPQRLRLALEGAGGTFIKLGQILALQPDVLPIRYCNALFDLMDRVPPFPYREVEGVVVAEFGLPPEELFEDFERVPIASASIGQVHRARVDGRALAVKVQRPSVEDTFQIDLRFLRFLSRQIRFWAPQNYHWLSETLDEFAEWTEEELDYRIEARYMDELARRASDNPSSRVPSVDWALTTSRVLTAAFLEGVPLIEHLRDLERSPGSNTSPSEVQLAALGFDPSAFASSIVENFLGDVFHHGIFHADLHPANLLILPNNVVGYVDFGITGLLSRHTRQGLIALTWAYTRGDVEDMVRQFLSMATTEARSDVQGFRDGIHRSAEDWFERDATGVRLRRSFTHVMMAITRLSHQNRVWIHREIVKYFRSVIAVEGLIGRFAPDFDLGGELEEYCRRAVRKRNLEEVVSFDRLVDQALATTRLLWDGPRRLHQALETLGPPRETASTQGLSVQSDSQRAVQFSALALGFAGLSHLVGPDAGLGPNPFSASILLAVASIALGLRSLWRVLRSPTHPLVPRDRGPVREST